MRAAPRLGPAVAELGKQRRREAYALDHEIETLVGCRRGDPRFTLPAKQRYKRGFELGQAPGYGGA